MKFKIAVLVLIVAIGAFYIGTTINSNSSVSTRESLADKKLTECEEKYTAFEESLDHKSVAFLDDPIAAAEEYCAK
jgi:hypothetical protein